nr:two-component regulator propeller domain-containing protein [uncultured Carboxylicivirga sp.]
MTKINSSTHYILAFIAISLFSHCLLGQSFDFKTYNSEVGLPQNYVYSLKQGHKGYLWIATGEGLVRYDGFEFKTYTQEDSLADNFVNTLYINKQGQLWCGHKNGNLSYFSDGSFHAIAINETNQKINDIREDQNNAIWAIEQRKGLIRIDENYNVSTFFGRKKYKIRNYYSLAVISDKRFLIGTSDGLYQIKFSDNDYNNVEVNQIPGIPRTRINSIVQSKRRDGDYWIGTEDYGFYQYKTSSNEAEHITDNRLCLAFNIEKETINDIYEDSDGHLLLATKQNGVIKLFYDSSKDIYTGSMNFSTVNGLGVNYITQILSDREGNYWFGTYGGGVANLVNQFFVFYNLEEIGFKNQKVQSVLKTEHQLWLGLDNGLIKHDPMCFTDFEYYDPALGVPRDKITQLYEDNNKCIWVATANNGLYYRPSSNLKFQSFNYTTSQSGKKINDLLGIDSLLYLATSEGLYIINTFNHTQKFYDMGDGLSHNTINFVYKDKNGIIWVGTKDNGICSITEDKIERHKIMQAAVNVVDMTEDKNGNKWLATKNKGVICYSVDSIKTISVKDGLKKNYCHSIECDSQNRLWICHHSGLSCIDLNTHKIRIFDHQASMNEEFNQVKKTADGNLWFASSNGAVNYNPLLDIKNNVAPILNLTKLTVDEESYPTDSSLFLPYPDGGSYNLRIDFRAISFSNPQGVTYEFKIDGVGDKNKEKPWTKLGDINFKEIDYLGRGEHKIRIRAYNADGIGTGTPLTVNVAIANQWWYNWWTLTLVILFIIYFVYLIIKFRERKLQRQKQILQKEVDSQTVVLREQKEEIERKNRDITDSINYAKKIQSSILPPKNELIEVLPESFIYFAPRDIVSGDFYWFNRNGDNLIICCADCTGHGVPGAFMSMIGTTILNDIFRLPEISSPADVLEKLDAEIKKLLQKSDEAQSKDGMDISVVEVHIPSRRVRLASAKRPVYLIINNEMTIYKGNRRSIGDSYQDGELNAFVNIEYNCSRGDQIYLFSDGYPDQFGGPLGKKFMKVGVRNLIEEIHELPSDKQFATVKANFEKWKGDLEQIDDVLFMGIKL